MHLSRFPRRHFAHIPTPLEPLDRLSEVLGGPRVWIKRDDCTGLSTGGNKTRKLEFLIGDALERGADTVITQGATQSNHARQTVAAAAMAGLECHILLEDRTGRQDASYRGNGNVLLDRLHGAHVSTWPGGTDMNAEMQRLEEELRESGRKPYVIPGGGSNEIGALGYVNAGLELITQANERDLEIDRVVHATGSAGTQAGLVTAFVGTNSGIPVLGIGVRHPKAEQEANVLRLAQRTADRLALNNSIESKHVEANCDYVGPGYGLPTQGMVDAVRLVAETEGILLDPVYSGKGMNGLVDLVRGNHFGQDRNIVFVHTGGSASLFGYPDLFEPAAG